MRHASSKLTNALIAVFITALLLTGAGPLFGLGAIGSAAQVLERRLTLSNNVPSQQSTYEFSFIIPTADVLGSMQFEFCDNTALFDVACSPPPGFDVSAASLDGQSGETGFSIDASTTANRLVLTRTPAATAGSVTVAYTLGNVQNANTASSQYARYSTYATADASGPATDRGSVAYALNPQFTLSTEVPPFLIVCVGLVIASIDCADVQGNYLNLGDLSTDRPTTGQSQMVIATNAANGYAMAISGQSLTSGTNGIAALADPTTSSPGNNQFGINLRNNSVPNSGSDASGPGSGAPTARYNQINRFSFRSGDIIASHNTVSDFQKYTVTYLVNISRSQPPGVYSSTFMYTGLGNF